ncbi:aquaporin [Streptomyces sp. NPDC048297]|uniref:aquaporin n=1 Tax=Streptomyces sp. NPDC048297 TaxID=3365531 RepID=UPI00370F7CA1
MSAPLGRRVSAPLGRRVAAEVIGTGLLVAVVVGSGIQATELSQDVGVQLLANSLATVFGLGVLITLFGPVSGAHFNPAVTLAAWFVGRRDPDGLAVRDVCAYVAAQVAGAIGGSVLADAMFARPLVKFSTHDRSAGHLWLGEVVATAGLVALVFGLERVRRAGPGPIAVACYIGAAYWFTSSTSFANPAVTVGRAFTDTFAGIAPASVAPFVAAQLLGAVLGLGVVAAVHGPDRAPAPREAAVPHTEPEPEPEPASS